MQRCLVLLSRRVDRLILGSPLVLRSITAVNVVGRRQDKVVRDWMIRFLPTIRYGNPAILFDFTQLGIQHEQSGDIQSDGGTQPEDGTEPLKGSSPPAMETNSSVPNSTAKEGSSPAPKEESQKVDTDTTGAGTEAAETADASEEVQEDRTGQYMELAFTDGTVHKMDLAEFWHSHQVQQHIIDADSEKLSAM